MATIEQPTFFGPAHSPLFGVLHLPADHQVREGILICPSLGKEAADSTRFQRILADTLASRGFAVLRFDYLGTGDSAYAQNRDDAAETWIQSVGHAVTYLRDAGIETISGIGHRAGSLILEAGMREAGAACTRLVSIDPVPTGRRYLREQSALFKISVGADAVPAGTVPIVGLLIAERAARQFGALALSASAVDSHPQRLFLMRDGHDDPKVRAIAEASKAECLTVSQMNSTLSLPMPLHAVDSIVSWFDRLAPAIRTEADPHRQLSADLPSEGEGPLVREHIERFGPKGLFAIRSAPVGGERRAGRTVLFCATSVDPHIGPGREWVEMSRRIAALGHVAVRWDREGLGNSPGLKRRQWHQIYRQSEIHDVVAAARHAGTDAADVCVVGVCSGSWYAAHAARRGAAKHLVLINPILWSWNARSSWASELRARRRFGTVVESPTSLTGQPAKPRLMQRAARTSARIQGGFHRGVPRGVRLALCRIGVGRVPESVLTPLARRGISTTVVLGPEDHATFVLQRGVEAVERITGSGAEPAIVHVGRGDHGAYHPALLQATRDAVDSVLGVSMSEERPAANRPLRAPFDLDEPAVSRSDASAEIPLPTRR